MKTSKKIRAFLYRVIAVGALFVFIASSLMGREALVNFAKEGIGTLQGEVYYLTEFREYISYLYQQGMLAYAGVGDDQGLAMKTLSAKEIQNQIKQSFQDELLEQKDDILYYVQYAGVPSASISNIAYPIFSEQDGHLLLPEDVQLCCYWDGEKNDLSFFYGGKYLQESYLNAKSYGVFQYKPIVNLAEKTQLVFAIDKDQEYQSPMMRDWSRQAEYYRAQLIVILSSGALFVIFGLLSLISIRYGKAAKTEYASVSKKIWLEVKVLLALAMVFVWYINRLGFVLAPLYERASLTLYMWLYFPIGCVVYLLWIDLQFGKAQVFLNSILVKFVLNIREYVRSLSWQRKVLNLFWITLISGLGLLIYSLFMYAVAIELDGAYYTGARMHAEMSFMVACFAAIVGVILLLGSIRMHKFAKDCNAITTKIAELKNGETSAPLKLHKRSTLSQTANDLNELENGIEAAVEQRNRSNKMRVELITNVSHDLKTPLTSIINYADLLCEEELPEPASEYAKALSAKAYRLKNMVQDVFDLSKATTGNLPVEKQRLDLVKLIRQTLADMDEKISESSLSFKLAISEEPLMIEADGDKLYRVFQNLFVNALQYSLDYSRVHIQLSTQDGFAVAKVKNTSKGELDFDTSEIIERFVRSDASRTTEGSGLGLSIVQSFTESCDGTFTIETDADMFTACVRFPLSQETKICEPVETILSEEVKLPEETSEQTK
ncbi:MAG: GHKL domain-containing protein [Lachnospiraceae bacterium]|nr:GHKL domain-containing protein [Lachnospiraceae bacterium]